MSATTLPEVHVGPEPASAEAAAAPTDPNRKDEPEVEAVEYATCFRFKDALLEEIVREEIPLFVLRLADGSQKVLPRLPKDNPRYAPLPLERLKSTGIRLPSDPEPYGSVEQLDALLMEHITKYVKAPPAIQALLPAFIRASWLQDKNRSAPYLRVSGPPGSGKSRFCGVVGHLCYKPYLTNGGTTEAALFRNLDKLGVCTTVLDENEHNDSDRAQAAITRILKVGFEQGGAVERCMEVARDGAKGQDVQRLYVFGMKLISAIDHVPDAALQSRCISVRMIKSRDVVGELPPEYEDEVAVLQNMLLQYRLDHFFDPIVEPEGPPMDMRLKQLFRPIARVATSEQLKCLSDFMLDMQAEIDDDEADTSDGTWARALAAIAKGGAEEVSLGKVIANAGREAEPGAPQQLGYFVKKTLGLKTRRPTSGRGARIIVATGAEILKALADAGYEVGESGKEAD